MNKVFYFLFLLVLWIIFKITKTDDGTSCIIYID